MLIKRYGLILSLCFGLSKWALADTPPVPTNSWLDGEIIARILNHGSSAEQYRKGIKQIVVSDNIIEAGHLNNAYIAGLDASVYQQDNSKMNTQVGLRLNLHALLLPYLKFTPEWQSLVDQLEFYPRVGYDFAENQTHAWFGSVNVGFGFGPGSGVTP